MRTFFSYAVKLWKSGPKNKILLGFVVRPTEKTFSINAKKYHETTKKTIEEQ